MAQYDVNNCSVSSLLADIKSDEIAIPEIQRPFVWDATKVRDLIDSLYQGYPVGYIIVWQNPDVKLKDGSTSIGKKVLIDGQQRVMALTAAIVAQEVVDSNYKKKRIRIAFNPMEETFEVSNPAISKNPVWIDDISPMFLPSFNAYGFVTEYCKTNGLESDAEKERINAVITRLRAIEANNLGVIKLSHELDIEKVTDIFIRINSKGVVLSQADFAMSKIASNENYGGNTIRKMIDYFCHFIQSPADYELIKTNDTEFAATNEFESIKWVTAENEDIYVPDYTDLLRVAFTSRFHRGKIADLVSLLSGRDFETKEYRAEIAQQSYGMLKEGVVRFVNKTNFQRYLMIVKSAGIIDASLIRSQNVLNFGYILYLTLRDKGVDANTIESAVRRWIVLSILTGRYSGSPESAFDYDIKRFVSYDNPLEYIDQIESGELSDAFWNNVLILRLNTSVASSPLFQVFLMAQVKAGDKGFLSSQIEVRSMLEHRGDIHHLFPKEYLRKNGINSKAMYNQIANYVYLQSEINIKIKDSAPRIYMGEVYRQCETKEPIYGGIVDRDILSENLKENCVPENFAEMDIKDYSAFLEERRKLMAQKIRKFYEGLK